jgi:hypothetical protein
MGSRLIIFFSIVGQREPCGMPSSFGSVSVGSCLARLRSYWPAGGRVVTLKASLFGKWSPYVLCGVFGASETIDASRTPRDLLRNSFIFFFSPFFSWTAGWLAPRVISFSDFLFLFSSPPSPLYTPSVLRVAPLCAFLMHSTNLSKKKHCAFIGFLK